MTYSQICYKVMVRSQNTLNIVFVRISELRCLFYTLARGESLRLVTLNRLNRCLKWRMLMAQSPFPPFLAVFVSTAGGLDSSLFCHHEPQRCVAREHVKGLPSEEQMQQVFTPLPSFFSVFLYSTFFLEFISLTVHAGKEKSKTKTYCFIHPLEKERKEN